MIIIHHHHHDIIIITFIIIDIDSTCSIVSRLPLWVKWDELVESIEGNTE